MNSFIFKKFFSFILLIIFILFLNWFFTQFNTEFLLRKLMSFENINNEKSIITIEIENNNILNSLIDKYKIDENNKSIKNNDKNNKKQNSNEAQNIPNVTFPININSASYEQLCAIPGIGPTIAQRIIEYIKSNGSIKNPQDLLKIKGIGEKKLETILKYIVF